MQIMRLISTIVLSFFCLLAWSQNTTISGKIMDGDMPLIGATVLIMSTAAGTYTDDNGFYKISTDLQNSFEIRVSYIGYENQYASFDKNGSIEHDFNLVASRGALDAIVVGASKYEERIIEAPVAIYKMSSAELKRQGGTDFYDAIANMRGLQAQTSSLFLPSYNTRGFSDPGNFRFKQQQDGYDLTNPIGLAIGNTVGVSDLDISSVELVHGASSALYGSDAFNGVLRLYSKNPFDFPGVSFQTKSGVTVQDAAGVNPYFEQDLRVAHLFNEKLAFKFDFNYKRAYDWIADDDSHRLPAGQWDNRAYYEGLSFDNPDGNLAYDALHRLGDEYGNGVGKIWSLNHLVGPNGDTLSFAPGTLTRTGISEKDLFTTSDFINNKMENFRANFSFFYRPAEGWEMEYTYKHSFSDWLIRSSSTFPQFDYLQRFHLFRLSKGGLTFRAYNHKLDNYKGTWSANSAADAIQQALNPNADWATDFAEKYTETGSLKDARDYADRYLPDGPEFNKEDFDAALGATSQNTDYTGSPNGIINGSQAVDFSNYSNVDLDYDFGSALPVKLQLGANYRRYHIESGGAFYNDGPLGFDAPIIVNQFAGYAQASKEFLDDKLKISAAIRADKQTDYNLNISPRATAVMKLGEKNNHIFRASYLTGFRNPSIQEGFFRLQLTSVYTIIGSAQRSLENFIYEGGSGTNYTMEEILAETAPDFKAVQPEKNTSFELGYKTIVNNKFRIDLSTYYTEYQNFINRPNIFFKPGTADFQIFAIRQNRSETVIGLGAGVGLDYLITDNFTLSASYDWSSYDSPDYEPTNEDIDDAVEKEAFLRSLQFNIPEHRANVALTGKQLGANDRFGFTINTRYNGSFNYYSNLGEAEIPSYTSTDMAITYAMPAWGTTLKFGSTNSFRQEYVPIYGAPQIGSVYYVGIRYEP